jgi:hypothetical protein
MACYGSRYLAERKATMGLAALPPTARQRRDWLLAAHPPAPPLQGGDLNLGFVGDVSLASATRHDAFPKPKRGARMGPGSRRVNSAVVFACLILAANATAPATAFAKGGGGGGGHGGGHGGGTSGYHSGYARSATLYRGGGGNGYAYGSSPGAAGYPPWVGFPEDLPAARIHRFFASHLPHFRWGANHRE